MSLFQTAALLHIKTRVHKIHNIAMVKWKAQKEKTTEKQQKKNNNCNRNIFEKKKKLLIEIIDTDSELFGYFFPVSQ